MSNVVNFAFTTIRAVTHMRRPPIKTTYHTDNGSMTTLRVPVIIKGPFCKWYRNPIWWWKMRHFRADIKTLKRIAPGPLVTARLRELEVRAFIHETGGSR